MKRNQRRRFLQILGAGSAVFVTSSAFLQNLGIYPFGKSPTGTGSPLIRPPARPQPAATPVSVSVGLLGHLAPGDPLVELIPWEITEFANQRGSGTATFDLDVNPTILFEQPTDQKSVVALFTILSGKVTVSTDLVDDTVDLNGLTTFVFELRLQIVGQVDPQFDLFRFRIPHMEVHAAQSANPSTSDKVVTVTSKRLAVGTSELAPGGELIVGSQTDVFTPMSAAYMVLRGTRPDLHASTAAAANAPTPTAQVYGVPAAPTEAPTAVPAPPVPTVTPIEVAPGRGGMTL